MRRKPSKKSNVVALRGEHTPFVITQAQLRELELAQRLAWTAHERAIFLAAQIKTAIAHGAAVESGKLYFDMQLGMARSKKTRGA